MQQESIALRLAAAEPDMSIFLTEASLWPSPYVHLESAWFEHVPFAYWLIEALRPTCLVELGTHCGLSYLSFCEAIDRLGVPCAAYAVDTWTGDEHAGHYGEEVYTNLVQVHDPRFSRFSRLVRSNFDAALDQFADRSIDLLHIDGLHSYEAVKHDFETWRPKLTVNAIVLFHDTNVRERGFGVWRLWQELRSQYQHFEFLHGHGLGILAVGNSVPDPVDALLTMACDGRGNQRVQTLFARLGGLIYREASTGQMVQQLVKDVVGRDTQIAALTNELVRCDHALQVVHNERAILNARLRELTDQVVKATEECTGLRFTAAAFSRDVVARDEKIQRLQGEIASRDHQIAARDRHITELTGEVNARRAECNEVRDAAAVCVKRVSRIKKSLSWKLTRPLRWNIKPRSAKKRQKALARREAEKWAVASLTAASSASLSDHAVAPLLVPSTEDRRVHVTIVSGEPHTPGHYYRVENLAAALAPRFYATTIVRADQIGHHLDAFRIVDILWIWRSFYTEELAQAIHLAREGGAAVIFDVDDLMMRPELATFSIIDGIRTQNFTEAQVQLGFKLIRATLDQADHVTTPTECLAGQARQILKPASVIPNGFDGAILRAARAACLARRSEPGDGLLRIGYASGSRTHQRDFAVCADAVAAVLADNPSVRLVLFEATFDVSEFPRLAAREDQIEWRSLVPVRDLPNEYARSDINIAPLEVGNVFCEAKSELKFFEAALRGVVTIASPTRPFADAIRHGETGFLAADNAEWERCLRLLTADCDLRRRVAEAGLADVLVRYGPERRSLVATRLASRFLATPAVAADLARLQLMEPPATAKPVDLPAFEILFASPRRAISRVAVVVPLYNYANFIEEALDSVAAQTVRDIELIVVDDCSTDCSAQVAQRWLAQHQALFNHVALLRNHANAKLSRTRNAGISYADTELILPLDADNLLLPECIERCAAVIDDTNAAVAYPTIELFGDEEGIITQVAWDPSRLQFGNYIDAMAMFRKACWLAVGGYRPIVHGWEDWDLWCQFVEAGFWGVRVPEVTARYRVHGASMLRTVTEVVGFRERAVEDLAARHPWLVIVSPPVADSWGGAGSDGGDDDGMTEPQDDAPPRPSA